MADREMTINRTFFVMVLVLQACAKADDNLSLEHSCKVDDCKQQKGQALLQVRQSFAVSSVVYDDECTCKQGSCYVGEAVQAKYNGGRKYAAHIASINGDTITVNWDDGDQTHREDVSQDVSPADGSACQVTTSVAPTPQASPYLLTAAQVYCPSGSDIVTQEDCQTAAVASGLSFAGVVVSSLDHRYCFAAADSQMAYFNTAGTAASPTPPSPNFMSICKASIPAELPPPQASATTQTPCAGCLIVSDAGSIEYNGVYEPDPTRTSGGFVAGYKKRGGDQALVFASWQGSSWGFCQEYGKSFDYYIVSSSQVPPSTGWITDFGGIAQGKGLEPPPTVQVTQA